MGDPVDTPIVPDLSQIPPYARTSLVERTPSGRGGRSIKKVPFVELRGGRVQGVVSSGSDIERVYVSFIESGTGNFNCSTNNNRPCGGLYASPCKHIHELVAEAMLQYGGRRVALYLALDPAVEYTDAAALLATMQGTVQKESSGVVFSRFLNYLRWCDLKTEPRGLLEMAWFAPPARPAP